MDFEALQQSMVMLGVQVLQHAETSLLEYNAFVTFNHILEGIHCPKATISIQGGTFTCRVKI